MKMFGGFGKSDVDMGIGEKRRLFRGPFQQEVRIKKRQNVSFGLPKITRKDQLQLGSPVAAVDAALNDYAVCNNNNMAEDIATSAGSVFAPKPLYRHESNLEKRKHMTLRRIEFAQQTKNWDGLRPDRLHYDELIHQFFVLGKQFSSVDVLRLIGLDSALVGDVDKLLLDLIQRIKDEVEQRSQNEEEDGVPVLLYGGGRGLKVTSFHLPYLQSLEQVVAEAERVVSLGFSLSPANCNNNDRVERQSQMIDV